MAAAPRLKPADKQEIYKKLLAAMKKRYSAPGKLPDLPVLETMIFAVCLENATVKDADASYKRLLSSFHDLNEIRVSSIDELEVAFQGMSNPDWRASRIRGILNYVFESTYTFEFEGLKRKTLELATKQLSKIRELNSFVRDFTLQVILGAHVLPLDDCQQEALEFLDLHAETGGAEQTAEVMRGLVRKADGPEFCALLREFALDPKFRSVFGIVRQSATTEGAELPAAGVRLDKLLKGEPIKFEGGTGKKIAPEKKNAEKVDSKKTSEKSAEKLSEKLTEKPVEKTADKPADKKPTATAAAKTTKKPEPEAKKPTTTRSAAEKVAPEKVAPEKPAPEKVAAEKAVSPKPAANSKATKAEKPAEKGKAKASPPAAVPAAAAAAAPSAIAKKEKEKDAGKKPPTAPKAAAKPATKPAAAPAKAQKKHPAKSGK